MAQNIDFTIVASYSKILRVLCGERMPKNDRRHPADRRPPIIPQLTEVQSGSHLGWSVPIDYVPAGRLPGTNGEAFYPGMLNSSSEASDSRGRLKLMVTLPALADRSCSASTLTFSLELALWAHAPLRKCFLEFLQRLRAKKAAERTIVQAVPAASIIEGGEKEVGFHLHLL